MLLTAERQLETGPFAAPQYYREPGLDLLLDDTVLPERLSIDAEREACRALMGSLLRQEVCVLDGSERESHPYTVTEQNFSIRILQPPAGNRYGVFLTHSRKSLGYHYDRRPHDPRISHSLTLEVDAFGNVLRSAKWHMHGGSRIPRCRVTSRSCCLSRTRRIASQLTSTPLTSIVRRCCVRHARCAYGPSGGAACGGGGWTGRGRGARVEGAFKLLTLFEGCKKAGDP